MKYLIGILFLMFFAISSITAARFGSLRWTMLMYQSLLIVLAILPLLPMRLATHHRACFLSCFCFVLAITLLAVNVVPERTPRIDSYGWPVLAATLNHEHSRASIYPFGLIYDASLFLFLLFSLPYLIIKRLARFQFDLHFLFVLTTVAAVTSTTGFVFDLDLLGLSLYELTADIPSTYLTSAIVVSFAVNGMACWFVLSKLILWLRQEICVKRLTVGQKAEPSVATKPPTTTSFTSTSNTAAR